MQMVAVFSYFVVVEGANIPVLPFVEELRSLISICINTFNILAGVWGTNTSPWAEECPRHSLALVE